MKKKIREPFLRDEASSKSLRAIKIASKLPIASGNRTELTINAIHLSKLFSKANARSLYSALIRETDCNVHTRKGHFF